jgi:hypothetical protein
MKVHIGDDKDSGLVHSVDTTAANAHDLTPAAELLHGDEDFVYGDAGYQGIAKRPEIAGKTTEFRVAMRTGKRRGLLNITEGRLQDLIETAKPHIRSKIEHPFRVIKQQFGVQKTRLRSMAKNRRNINVLAALTNLFLARRQLIATVLARECCAQTPRIRLKYQPDYAENEPLERPRGGLKAESRPKAALPVSKDAHIPVAQSLLRLQTHRQTRI